MTATASAGFDPLVASPAVPDADGQLQAAINRLFVRRTRLALATLLGGMVLFSLTDLWGRGDGWGSLYALRAASAGLIAGVFALLRQPRLLPYVRLIAWLVFAIACTLIALGGITSTVAASATPLLCVLMTFTAGAFFPWGVPGQLSAVAVAAVSIATNLYWMHTPGHPIISYRGAEGVVLCLLFSVMCGFSARSRLLALIQDNLARKRAEDTLRASNQHLEQRVQERVAEIETAKQALARQIVDSHKAAARLRDSENLLHAVIDNSSAIIYLKDLDGRYLLTNAEHARVLGYAGEAIAGKTAYDIHPADVAARLTANDRQVLTANRPVQLEEVVMHDDEPHTYLSVKFPVSDRNGTPYGLGGISRDITERKRMESALRQSQSTLSALIENSDEGIWALDREYRVQLLNSVARRRFPRAYGIQPTIGVDLRTLVPGDGSRYWGARSQQALSGERIVEETTITIGGVPQQFLVSLNPIVEATGITGVTIFVKDITALKRTQEQVRQHQAELAQVLRRSAMGEVGAELAHEINQPLGAIANYAQGCRRRLESGNVEPAELSHVVDEIAFQARRAGGILEHLEHAVLQEPPRHESIDVNAVVNDAVRALQLRCAEVRMEIVLAPDLPPGCGEVIHIEQVVLNLLHNALDAMHAVPAEERRLTVATRRTDSGTIEVTVSDTGSGLDPAVADTLFQPFVTTKADGLGMGLAICHSIVEAHHGRLWVTSPAGRGCTFHFTIPTATIA